jgi:hypothetical protein
VPVAGERDPESLRAILFGSLPEQYRDDALPTRVAIGIFGLWLTFMLVGLVGWLAG